MANVVSIKSTIPQSAPAFIQEDHPIFIQFVESYFEYLEQQGGPIDFVRNALSYVDPSKSMDSFINQFFEEMKLIPNSAVVDKQLLAQHIYDLYQAKGTIKSFELFFRLMFNEDVQIYFPKDDLLRVSDGKWNRSIKIRVTVVFGDIFSIIGNRVFQYSDTNEIVASANVEQVVGVDGTQYFDIILNPDNIVGHFDYSRQIVFGDVICHTSPVPKFDFAINRGSGYTNGDRVVAYSGSNLLARVDSVLGGGITNVDILDGGTGHAVGDIFTVTSDTGSGADIRVAGIHGGTVTSISIVSPGQGYESFPTIELSNGQFIAHGDRIGAIGNFKIEDPGYGFDSQPDVSVDTLALLTSNPDQFVAGEQLIVLSERLILESGFNILDEASELFLTEEQSIETFDISIFPQDGNRAKIRGIIRKLPIATEDEFSITLEDGSSIIFELSSGDIFRRTIRGTTSLETTRILYINPAHIDSTLSAIYDGGSRFISVDGNLSETTKRIQDSRYYQEFSYVIKSAQSISTYRNAIYSLLHPAGLAMFGSIDIESKVELIVNVVSELSNIITKILESYITNQSTLANNVITIESEVLMPTNMLHDYRWLEQNKFILSPHGSIVAHTKLTPQRYINTPTISETLQIKDVGNIAFDHFYRYLFADQEYLAYGYVEPGYIGINYIGPSNYFDSIYVSQYYLINNSKLNIGWDSDIVITA